MTRSQCRVSDTQLTVKIRESLVNFYSKSFIDFISQEWRFLKLCLCDLKIILTGFFSICSLFPASIVEANQNIKLMIETNIELLSNPYRSLSRYGSNDRRTVIPYVNNRSENKNLAPSSYDASNAWPQTSRMPNPSQEQLLKIPATGSCRCYNDDPFQGRISHSGVENYRSVMIHFKGST